ncbi:MAG TPA: hypothetical protein VGH16_11180 [Candidatus Binatia bacterium]|jgi:hypothetical protein
MSGGAPGSNPVSDMRDLLARGYVAPSPSQALERIRQRFSCELTVRGSACAGIATLRRLIASMDAEGRYARSLLITAPHTHWGERAIVESFDADRRIYLIGAQSAVPVAPYSFVFSADGPIPYEWAGDSVPLNAAELEEARTFIGRLNAFVAAEFPDLPIPLGVTIDHRFKKSIFDAQIFAFAETPPPSGHGPSIVRALVESVVEANPRYPGALQAAWFSAPDEPPSHAALDERERAALARLEKILAGQPPDDALRFVEELESYLRGK